jgi:acyl-CoA synthetase (AMP-forming)/AMP-acid ligase II
VLRIKAEGLFEGYLDDETATAAALRDGWFYPGDLAILGEDGLLSIEGRVAEFMNLGGVKIAPPAVDEAALACPGVLEAAAFSVPDAQGIEQPWIAVVRGEGFAERALIDALDARWPALRRTRIAFIDRIPRNAMGKPERQKLKAIINEALPRLAAAQPGPEAPKFPESLPPTAP